MVGERSLELGAAGPFIADQVYPLGCFRSHHNYAHLAAAPLGLTLRDPACSGAKIADMYVAQPLPFGGSNIPQMDAVASDAAIVSVDFGINDYADDGWTATALVPKLAALLDDIRARAPQAKIFVMGKIERVRAGGCFPQVPLPPAQADLIYSGVEAVNAVLGRPGRGARRDLRRRLPGERGPRRLCAGGRSLGRRHLPELTRTIVARQRHWASTRGAAAHRGDPREHLIGLSSSAVRCPWRRPAR
ncbi:GDSL-type esterase/lipase family protein [Nocardia sp. NPDC051052]|uniref:GDSL-type esterase/lipase family protein n=1 Tax=Nocardia sp. NPDC051052 TaxID=3364322 RepID=UPI00379BDE91